MMPLRQKSTIKELFDLSHFFIHQLLYTRQNNQVRQKTDLNSYVWTLMIYFKNNRSRGTMKKETLPSLSSLSHNLWSYQLFLVPGWRLARGGLRETKLGHLHIQVCKCVGVVAVVLVVFVSAVIKQFFWLWRHSCSFCSKEGEGKKAVRKLVEGWALQNVLSGNRNKTRSVNAVLGLVLCPCYWF